MAESSEALVVEVAPQWAAEPLTRVLELLAAASGGRLEPRDAWEAAAEGIAGAAHRGPGEAQESLQLGFALAARRAGLRLGHCRLGWPCEAAALAELEGPAVTWIPGRGGGTWLLVEGRRGRRLDMVLVDGAGERRRTGTPAELAAWVEAQRVVDGQEAQALPWLHVESLLPLAPLESASLAPQAGGRVSELRRLIAFAQLERADLGVVVVYALAIGAMSLAVPVAVQALVNTVAFGSVLQPLVVLTLLLAAVLSFVAVLRVLEVVVVEAMQRRLFLRTAADFARRLPRLSEASRQKVYGPELANRFFDVVGLQKAGAKLLLDGLALVLQMAVGMLLLAFYHPLLLAFDLALLLAVGFVIFVVGRGAVASSLRESDTKYAVAAWLEDVAGSPLRFGGAAARAFADARAELLGREWLHARSDHFRRVMRQLYGGLGLQVIAGTALLGIGGMLVIQRQLTLGQLVAAELVVTAIGAGLGKLGRQLEAWYDAVASAAKIAKVVDMPLERAGGERLAGGGPVALRLSGPGERELELAPGAKLGLRGWTRDHSRLLDQLLGRAPLDGVDLRVDGRPVDGLDLESLRAQLWLVRGLEFVGGTLRDNLDPLGDGSDGAEGFARVDASALREVLEHVGLRECVAALPDGLDARMLPTGQPLHVGEARRVMLARALLRRPRLLLLDGALDGLGLDDAGLGKLLDYVLNPDAPWTAIVVSEDPRVLARCELAPAS